jgi:predicted PurR-regulated permease PerM
MNSKKVFSDEFLTKALKVLGVVLLSLAVIFMLSLFSEFIGTVWGAITSAMIPFIIAWLISLIMYPAIQFFERRGVGPRGLSVTIVYLLVGVLAYFFFYLLTPAIIEQVRSFFAVGGDYEELVNYFQNDFRSEFILGTEIYDQILGFINDSTILEDLVSGFVNTVTSTLGSSITGIIAVVMVLPILLLYYLVDYELINDNIRSVLPIRYEKDASDLGNRMNRTVGAYIRGQIILMFAIGTVATVAYRLVGLNYFFIFGLIVGLTNIIPYFGAIIAMVPVLIYAIITKDVNPFLILAINIVLQFIEGNIFQPMIMGRQLEMHPLIIIGSILFFGSLFGALGVIFAAPLAATIRVLFNFYKEKREQRLTT